MVTMLGWLRAEAARASCSKRRKRSLSEENAVGRILIATPRSKRASRARYTSPIPPAPSSSTISYGPSLVPEVRAIAHAIIFPGKGLAVGPTVLDGWSTIRKLGAKEVTRISPLGAGPCAPAFSTGTPELINFNFG